MVPLDDNMMLTPKCGPLDSALLCREIAALDQRAWAHKRLLAHEEFESYIRYYNQQSKKEISNEERRKLIALAYKGSDLRYFNGECN